MEGPDLPMRWVDHATINQPASRANAETADSEVKVAAIPSSVRQVPMRIPVR